MGVGIVTTYNRYNTYCQCTVLIDYRSIYNIQLHIKRENIMKSKTSVKMGTKKSYHDVIPLSHNSGHMKNYG